jgi:transglutaminase-like putative cysteine protease
MMHTAQAGFHRAVKAQKFITLLLLFILLTVATASVTTVLTGPDWASLWESLLFGLLIGWLFAVFRWPAWRSTLMVVVLGLLYTLFFTAGLDQKIILVFDEFLKLLGGIVINLSIKSADLAPLYAAIQGLISSMGVVLGRAFSWLDNLVSGQPGFDPVAASLVWSFIVWLVAAWAGWMVEAARNAIVAVLPALIMCLSTLSYVRRVSSALYLLLGISLVLIAVVNYDHREQDWTETRVAYPEHKSRQVGNVAVAIAILLVILSAVISTVSLQRIIRLTSAIRGNSARQESGLAKSLGIVPGATLTPDTFSNLRSPGLPRELLIGAGPELSGEQVMTVKVSDLASLMENGQLPPIYWRSFTYDIYTGHGWSSSATQETQFQPGQPFQPDHLPEYSLIHEQISLVPGVEGQIYAAGEPVVADVPAIAAWRSSNDLFGIRSADNAYTVESLVPTVDENTLRQAGQEYPGWIAQRYLALPASLPARVKTLAIQLTASEPTPYDRAHAIEQYLRQSYPYTLDVPYPPANQDLVDYFLFDLREGYCDYYASAMVVLARAAGIPARLAIGYASGTYNLNSQRFLVTEAEAHSWVEVYFPSIGWVPFEPTAGLPAINRSTQPVRSPIATPPPPPVTSPSTQLGAISIGKYSGVVLLLLILVSGLSWSIWDEVRLRRLNASKAAAELYRRMRRYGLVLNVPTQGGETPYEFSNLISIRISEISRHAGMPSIGAQTAEGSRGLIQRIVRISYRPDRNEPPAPKELLSTWNALRWKLRWTLVGKLWESITYRGQNSQIGNIARNTAKMG